MDATVAALVGAGLGGIAGGIGQAIARFFERRLARQADRETEQKRVAQEILGLVAKFCRDHDKLSHDSMTTTVISDKALAMSAALLVQRDDIAERVVELTDSRARAHLDMVDSALCYIAQPTLVDDEAHFNNFPVRESARRVLGAIIRGDEVPEELSDEMKALVRAARNAFDELDRHRQELKEAAEALSSLPSSPPAGPA